MKSFIFLLLTLYLLQNTISYNPSAAIAYAEQWAKRRNPNYHDYSDEGGDCANFVSQCLIAGGFSTDGCSNYGYGGTVPYVLYLEQCLLSKGWKKATSMPSSGVPAGSVVTFNQGEHTVLVVQGGTVPLVAGHTRDVWMETAEYGTRTYFWDPNADSTSDTTPVKPGDPSSINWFPYVTGYDISDSYNGFAGDYGRPIVGLKVKAATYTVHETGGSWLKATKNNRIAGTGKPIDGVAIKGGQRYRVHILGGGWLSPVTGYNTKDEENGYAGILGKTIDAIAIEGHTYASGY